MDSSRQNVSEPDVSTDNSYRPLTVMAGSINIGLPKRIAFCLLGADFRPKLAHAQKKRLSLLQVGSHVIQHLRAHTVVCKHKIANSVSLYIGSGLKYNFIIISQLVVSAISDVVANSTWKMMLV